MAPSITDPRYAHAEGFTTVAFGRGGDFICTGGSDSLVRVFYSSKAERDQEAITLEQHSDNVLTLSVSRSKIISGDEEGTVFCFDVSTSALAESGKLSVEPSGTVLRSVLPARDISISSSERQAAIATDDENVTVVSLLDMGLLHTLTGHRGSVNSVSYSPDSAYLASTGCNGTVRVWDMREDEPSCISVMHKMAYVCEPGNSMDQSKARWSPDGRFVAVPCSDHTIKLVERGTWQASAALGGRHTKKISHVTWSPNSRYMASVGLDGQVVVWDVAARTAILSHATAGALCQIDWNPCGNMLAFTDGAGAMYIWDDVIPSDQGHAPPYERQSDVVHETVASHDDNDMDSAPIGGLFDDGDGADGGEMDSDGADDDIDDGEALDDFVVDDDGGGYAERQAPRWMASDAPAHAFQPGSTPWVSGRRYLAFNMVGSVVAVAQDSYNSIDITFHDKSLHRDVHFSDSFRFALAALTESGCLFATTTKALANDHALRSADDAESVLSFRAFASWSASADWMFKLPLKEHPRCIAASSHGAAAVTSLGMLRLFTCGGVQRHIESLPGRVVTCVARGDLLLVVLEALGSVKSNMGARRLEYEYVLMTMDGQTRVARGCCPVGPGAEIVWAGFSEEGHPATCDSKGMLRVLHRYWAASDACWVPVLDTRRLAFERGNHETFWPVALSASQFIVATCKPKTRFPPFPAPILDELDVEVPLLHTDTSVGQQEAKLFAARLFGDQLSGEAERSGGDYPGGASGQSRDDLEQDKLLLRLIQLACKADKSQRAVDLAQMIKLDRSFDAAIKIAVYQKQTTLAERLMRIKDTKFGSEDDEYDNVHNSDDEQPAPAALNARRHRPPAATYGQKQNTATSKDSSDMDLSEDGADTVSTKPGGMAAAMLEDDGPELVVRPAKPPVTSKPFNPFGVAAPSTSMEIKRSDSFFKAADLHSESPSDVSSRAASPSKRQQREDGAAIAPRKQAKMSAFQYKKKAPIADDADDEA
ncbi:DNA polymerase alpha accessory factor Mcl1 [Coemansia sp. RSA 2523]|nr:DNA polymerase alpha accessory factor Mcl1 [Coemansia sp. RSA 1591]KAJ1777710.1 DNA polymerase alpha accessory factor Mcl1 [Coemansia sp. RSA 1824]KAJ1806159.1 DNA polymerase alpha accessory factor Mcl1 [Coemansia sp. RSA 2523]KAJ2256800.1 DNA polymerase alpha accessory factor Mcl1 [Coemansia sp. RSA 454]KAJ2651787.1 DNA polymerase alpha accessory factor Mcl1 [Coemansia sp. RSA 1287]